MSEELKTEGQQAVSVTTEFEIPPECCVVFYNDDYTTKDFVVEVLETVFAKSRGEAVFLMEQVHSEGSAVIGVYTYDIAVTRAGLATAKAKKAGFPLKIEVKR
ncbi:MAG: ATP-dependent Clp protease adaptor ClpS [Treponema porcinum]|uniref:ATP-dependent Clp protease adaptor ClpS n=1 Tax=Treponema porcinum TaxID=261392 RepID=UPI002355435F|nr:ATP-dependent Clp protease adaptor ClpS [Treponema porcinum]MCI6179174.1 ATP-dependent Clp protease adaptor ClpS [Treponema porcinum]MCI6983258.1 ATP-dependent Clp protease adaptor ClpS [Treponema porcinum]MCI7546684.1 ATP-dependent Clp protease adaptor ClpS [Treponema porcinum]